MTVQWLSTKNIDKLVEFEKKARATEPDVFLGEFDAAEFTKETLASLNNPQFALAKCLMCMDANENAIGRLDFSLVASFAFGGDLRAYVDWVYVLKNHRHKGVARLMFAHVEKHLAALGVHEYFLITAENQEAQRFYHGIPGAHIQSQGILTKKC